MRRRLMFAFVGLVAVVLVIAGAGSLILTRNAARNQATTQLVAEVEQALTSAKSGTQSLAVLKVVRHTLRLEDARFIRVTALATIPTPLPSGISQSDLDPASLLAGQTVSGRAGGLVFAASPVELTPTERARLKLRGQVAVVFTRQVGDLGPSWGYFIVAGLSLHPHRRADGVAGESTDVAPVDRGDGGHRTDRLG